MLPLCLIGLRGPRCKKRDSDSLLEVIVMAPTILAGLEHLAYLTSSGVLRVLNPWHDETPLPAALKNTRPACMIMQPNLNATMR
mmetsp:Transcript_17713/g.54505  ORF Transcript_17713/g.54505 Transcript_17713/m.54505 type:complete len:84 (-) Transcript_17713:369-620(-)